MTNQRGSTAENIVNSNDVEDDFCRRCLNKCFEFLLCLLACGLKLCRKMGNDQCRRNRFKLLRFPFCTAQAYHSGFLLKAVKRLVDHGTWNATHHTEL